MSTTANQDRSEAAELSGAQVLRRNFGETVLSSLGTLGRSLGIEADAMRVGGTDLLRMRFPFHETLNQAWFLIRVTALPSVLMAIPFGVIVSAQVGNIVSQLGADSMIGAAGGLGVIKQGAPLATAMLLGGAGAAAIAADLGARTIREEVDAMRVMGVDPVQRLVVPRIAAMMLVAPLLNVLIIFIGIASGFAVAVTALGATPGSYWQSFGSFTAPIDIWVSLIKSLIFGFLVVVIACQRGLEAKGGPRGVADGVNAAVVMSVAAVTVLNTAITQVVTMFIPVRMA
ncbi:MlaE family ABC transporter permease [Nocardia seriolae]|uniref:ABC transporter permease n=1 Tax=Nocardia seriolae TaxID=37332 RepID=A0A0B8NIP5_9NOCA|nr:ABC transporter permease [Nocardia seriolae]APA97749.1 putative ABC transporter permease protein [Nocardia seriolae]MTJ64480.1 ABC transporter permease [Nocardia seriolae]MTJ74744.1 ABC transporter permease [Nocardia seriolae]MTJ87528.1 ABC transporter permease [Nocardia seriolae]MTK31519.1 ABC transporter permease [Nocardia seriolae]